MFGCSLKKSRAYPLLLPSRWTLLLWHWQEGRVPPWGCELPRARGPALVISHWSSWRLCLARTLSHGPALLPEQRSLCCCPPFLLQPLPDIFLPQPDAVPLQFPGLAEKPVPTWGWPCVPVALALWSSWWHLLCPTPIVVSVWMTLLWDWGGGLLGSDDRNAWA